MNNFPFEHIIVPESVFPIWKRRAPNLFEHVTSFPDDLLPKGIEIVKSPVFGIDGDGKVVDYDCAKTRLVGSQKIGERRQNFRPLLYDSSERSEMIHSVLDFFTTQGLKYLYCIVEKRGVSPIGIWPYVSIIIRGC